MMVLVRMAVLEELVLGLGLGLGLGLEEVLMLEEVWVEVWVEV